MELHLELKELRLKHKLSQVEVGERAGLSRKTVIGVEQGNTLTVKTLEVLAAAIGYEVQIKFVRKL
jgi:transcriptional regulator with XRE-family HTH domain